MARTIVDSVESKKGEDILLLDIREIAIFADYFVICSGTSERMLAALADAAIEGVKTAHEVKGRVEGSPREGWLLVDWGDVVLHIFSPQRRGYYRLEELWSQAKIVLRLQ